MIEFFTTNLWLIWVIISIVCLILKLSSGDCFILCFAIGAAASAIVAGCGASLTWQVIVFAVVSALSLLLLQVGLEQTGLRTWFFVPQVQKFMTNGLTMKSNSMIRLF